MAGEKELLFEVLTPLGFRVRVTRAYWEMIVTVKHPVMLGREEDVRKTLGLPDEIRQSKSDVQVYLFYRPRVTSAGDARCHGERVTRDS